MDTKILRVIKRAILLVLPVIFIISLASCKKNTKNQYPTPTEKFFVNDFAGVMTEEDINNVYTKGVALNDATTTQAVIVTIESLDGEEASNYALEIGRQWGVGTEEENNGVVILFSESDREIYIAVGYGLEGALPDSKTGRIIDNYGMSYFSNDDFSTGLVSVYNAIVNEIYVEYGMQPQDNYVPIDLLPDTQIERTTAGEVALSWLALIVLVALYLAVFGRRGGLFIFGSPRFFGSSSFHHHSSFGGSNGGFGGFRGGGGSFGGGGAGRRF